LKRTTAGLNDKATRDHVQRAANEQGLIAFQLFSQLTIEVLRRFEFLRKAYGAAYPLILVDEFQDTSDEQEEVLLLLAEQSQLVAFADPQQRIFSFRRGVHAGRLQSLKTNRKVTEIQLPPRSFRAPDDTIPGYAQAVLDGHHADTPPQVKHLRYFNGDQQDQRLYEALGQIGGRLKKELGRRGEIAILARTNALVRRLSRGLTSRSVVHRVAIDTTERTLAWRAVVSLLAPTDEVMFRIGTFLDRLSDLHAVVGTSTNSGRLKKWGRSAKERGKLRSSKHADAIRNMVAQLSFSGQAADDGARVQESILALDDPYTAPVREVLELAPPFAAWTRVDDVLSDTFDGLGYEGAVERVDRLMIQESLIESNSENRFDTLLTTVHRAKGKEFDGIIIVDGFPQQRRERLYDPERDEESRYLLNVAITRARHAVLILHCGSATCEIVPECQTTWTEENWPAACNCGEITLVEEMCCLRCETHNYAAEQPVDVRAVGRGFRIAVGGFHSEPDWLECKECGWTIFEAEFGMFCSGCKHFANRVWDD